MVEKRSFRYHERSKEDVRERANMRGGNFDSFIKPAFKLYKVKDGKNLIRILPPTWQKPKHYGYDIFVNYNIGADNQSYLSLGKMLNKPDPLAEARREAESEGDEALAKALRPTQRIAMWLIDRNAEDEGPLLWTAPFTVDKAFANLAFDLDTGEVIYIDDPEQGCDVRFYKEGTGMLTKYDASKMKLQKPSPISQDQDLQDQWLEYIAENPIPECLQYYDAEHIAGIYDGKVHTQDADDEVKAPPRKPAPEPEEEAPPPRRRPVVAAEPEDEEPAPRRTRPRIAAEPEPEDEAPPPRRRAPPPEDDEPPAGESIRDRIRRRRAEAEPAEED